MLTRRGWLERPALGELPKTQPWANLGEWRDASFACRVGSLCEEAGEWRNRRQLRALGIESLSGVIQVHE